MIQNLILLLARGCAFRYHYKMLRFVMLNKVRGEIVVIIVVISFPIAMIK